MPRVTETVRNGNPVARGESCWGDWPNHNPYGHLSEAELTELRYVKQERYEQLQDQYRDAYQDWAFVMNALKVVRESEL